MRNTPFDTRSSEWIGDMTVYLRETGEDNSLQLERLRRNLRRAREAELTDRQRQMLELHYDQRLPVTEIARRLGVHTSTVSRTLERARQRLRRCLRYTL
nr:sigma-70 family RNA polymerase sigma factor [uncultured Dysosmobacter sp.]